MKPRAYRQRLKSGRAFIGAYMRYHRYTLDDIARISGIETDRLRDYLTNPDPDVELVKAVSRWMDAPIHLYQSWLAEKRSFVLSSSPG